MSKSSKSILITFLTILTLVSCSDEIKNTDPEPSASSPEWLLPEHRIFDGGPGRDGIPSIDNPTFVDAVLSENFMRADDLVAIVRVGDETKIYPYKILDWHEIVNDEIAEEYVAISYCPLTGTSMTWDRHLALGVTTFGVSGLLFNTNLIPYERETGSEWSQILMKGVHGWYKGRTAETFKTVETSWATARQLFPDGRVLNIETGFDRPYGEYPYGDYREASARLLFPVVPLDERLHLKERVHGIAINDKSKVYRFNNFVQGARVLNDEFQNTPIVVFGDEKQNFIVSYDRTLSDGTILNCSIHPDDSFLFIDDQGNSWNIFGEAIDGPNQGEHLTSINSLMGYWLSFSSFYPVPEIVGE